MWTKACNDSWEFIKNAIILDPCLVRFDPCKRIYIRTNYCNKGMGAVVLQPASDPISMAAMMREMQGGPCEFMKQSLDSLEQPVLRPSAFIIRYKGYEYRLHSYLGEAYAGNYGLHKFEHYWWGSRSTWITDSHAICFILTYDGTNGPLCRLQMRIMMIHCNMCACVLDLRSQAALLNYAIPAMPEPPSREPVATVTYRCLSLPLA